MNESNTKRLYDGMVTEFADPLYRYACRMIHDRESARDLVQETYEQAWKSIDRLDDVQKRRSWIFQILRHRINHWLRRTKRRVERAGSTFSIDASEPSIEIESQTQAAAIQVENQEFVEQALEQLSEAQREVVLLAVMEDLTVDEVAEVVGLPRGTVLSRIHRGKEKLKAWMVRQRVGYSAESDD